MQFRFVAGVAACAASFTLAAGASAAPYDPDTVIVKFEPGTPVVGNVVGSITANDAKVLRVAGDPAAVAARLNALPNVLYAEPNYILRASAIPNDPSFGQLYGLHNTGQTGGRADADIDAPEGWDLAGLGAFPATGGVKVGIVDTGIDQSHPELSGKVANCAATTAGLLGIIGGDPNPQESRGCADDHDHGTHVAGTIAAKANNGVGVAGVAFNANLAICKALHGPLGTGSTAAVANCITYVHNRGAKVISMSLGGGASTTLQNAVANAWKNGAANGSVLVAAAGNDGNSAVNYPAGYAQVISVAATDNRDAKASFSNTNADVEVAGPGVGVLSTVRGGTYRSLSGTSMATPHASGVAAVLWQLNAGQTAQGIRNLLTARVDDLGAAGRDTSFGFGRVNLCKAAGGSCAYAGG
jgi:thermitase